MDTLSSSHNEFFSSDRSSPDSIFEPTATLSPPSSGVSTPATEPLGLSESFHGGLTANPSLVDDYILVVGGLGFIESHTSWEVLKSGHNIVIIDGLGLARR